MNLPAIACSSTVEPLYNGHLGNRRKSPLLRVDRCREVEKRVDVWTVHQKRERWFREVAVSGGSTVVPKKKK